MISNVNNGSVKQIPIKLVSTTESIEETSTMTVY